MKYILNICVDNNSEEVINLYKNHVEKHNAMVETNPFPDSGFDLFCLNNDTIDYGQIYTLDTKITCAAYKDLSGDNIPSAFYLYPRSSISKTPLRLANSVGIIDSGYRGNIIAKLNNTGYTKTGLFAKEYQVEYKNKYVQICMPDLSPFKVNIVNNHLELGTTERGDGGFGSTGV